MATPLTDHKSFLIKTNISPNANCNTQFSYWKMNRSLFKWSEVKQELERLINYYWVKGKNEELFRCNWKLLKFEFRKYLRKFSSTLAIAQRLMEEKVVQENWSFSSIANVNLLDGQRLRLTEQQNKLDNMYRTRAQGAFIRSRQKWLEYEEQMFTYFLNLKSLGLNSILKWKWMICYR